MISVEPIDNLEFHSDDVFLCELIINEESIQTNILVSEGLATISHVPPTYHSSGYARLS